MIAVVPGHDSVNNDCSASNDVGTGDGIVVRTLFGPGCADEIIRTSNGVLDRSELDATDVLLIHQPDLGLAADEPVRSAVETVRAGTAEAAMAVLPVTDTIKILGRDETLHGTWDRQRLRELRSPLCCRASLLSRTAARTVPGPGDLPPGVVRLVADEPTASNS